jgi:hydroxyacylglutathione hydrolase
MGNTSTALELVTVPCLSDNYAFLVHNSQTNETVLIDAPESAPIQAALDARGWVLTDIVLTHHHPDHIDGVDALRGAARVIGAKADVHRLPDLDLAVTEGDDLTLCSARAQVFDVSGHTLGHIAIYLPEPGYAFTADSLMALGCGRLFEGTPALMWESLQKLRALPDDTLVCSGHEYTESNARFALDLDPTNTALISRGMQITSARAANKPTVPSLLGDEKRTNPFLRADDPVLKVALGMETASDDDVFAYIRVRKDKF